MQAEKLSITLPSELAEMVREKVGTGAYASNSEVIREGLRLLRDRDVERAQKLAWLSEKVESSIKDGEPVLDEDEAFAELERRSGVS